MNYQRLTASQAGEQGYFPLTRAYRPSEQAMLAKVLADMKRRDIPVVLVRVTEKDRHGIEFNGLEVWRYRGY